MSMNANLTLKPINSDFDASVSMADFAFESIYPLELTTQRLTALFKLSAGDVIDTSLLDKYFHTTSAKEQTQTALQSNDFNFSRWQGIEVFVLEGTFRIEGNRHTQGSYIRIPAPQDKRLTAITDCILFIKLNQFLQDDTGTRNIETRAADKWLPGPVDGIEIRPLHVFDTESIMLLRWQHAAEFKPKLNPRGEEILVINGLLQNRDHLYRQYSWIRNPIEDWCKWHGNTGTMAYYKSGHFPDDPARTNTTNN